MARKGPDAWLSTAPAELLPKVEAAVREAGALIRAEFHRPGGPRGLGGSVPVNADVADLLRDRLTGLLPAGRLAEETGRSPARSGLVWLVAPQDGTPAFLKVMRGSSVSVALMRDGVPVLGIVHAPTAPNDDGDLFAWAEGAALTRNGTPLASDPDGPGLEPGTVIALDETAPDHLHANAAALAPARFLAVPSIAYRLALAAAGEVDAAVAFESLAPRDVAGGHALLLGAGRQLADLAGRAVTAGDGPSIAGCVGGGRRTVAAVAGSGPAKAAGRAASPRRPARPRAPVPIAALLDRAQGTLLGQLAGDALGSAVEFQPARRIAETHPEGVRDLVSGGTWGTMAGQPTDDSEMALALARSLAREGGFDAARVGAAYVAWGESDPFDIGNTTREGLAAIAAGRPARSESQANGALMRVSPIGILAAGNPARAAAHAAQDAALTHPHPVCRAASAGFAAAVAVGVAGGGREAMWAAAHAHAGEGDGAETVRATLRAARHGPPAHYGGEKMGWVLIALRNAVWQLMRGASLETAVIGTVSAGGDTDTNAAICGALLGAHAGRQAVPARWRRLVLSCRPIPGADTRHPRPPDYWPDDAMALAEAVLAAGREG